MTNYLLSEIGNKQLTEHISLAELQCDSKRDLIMVCEELLDYVEQLMLNVNATKIIITSGNRDEIDVANGIGHASDQHQLGRAIDAKFYTADGNQIEPPYICCKAQDMGFEGIGHMRYSTHLDRRVSGIWHGDELNNDRNVSDFYSYFGISREPVDEPITDEITINEGDVSDMNREDLENEVRRVYMTLRFVPPTDEEVSDWADRLIEKSKSWKDFYDELSERDDAVVKQWIKSLAENLLDVEITDSWLNWWLLAYRNHVELTKEVMYNGFATDYIAFFNQYNQ